MGLFVWYEYDAAGNPTRKFLYGDERGSVIAVAGPNGAATGTARYSPDGESAAPAAPFGYTGQLWIGSLQLYYYKARMYSPKAARFIQPDPIGYLGGMNVYAYAANDPINATDPSGLNPCMTLWEDIFRTTTNILRNPDGSVSEVGVTSALAGRIPYEVCLPGVLNDTNTGGGSGGGDSSSQEPQGPTSTVAVCSDGGLLVPTGGTNGVHVPRGPQAGVFRPYDSPYRPQIPGSRTVQPRAEAGYGVIPRTLPEAIREQFLAVRYLNERYSEAKDVFQRMFDGPVPPSVQRQFDAMTEIRMLQEELNRAKQRLEALGLGSCVKPPA